MTKDEALRLALEALENMENIRDCQREKGYPLSDADKRMQKAITAIKAALEAKDEPVGEVLNERGEVDYISYVPPVGTALYTTPPKQEAKNEPVVCGACNGSGCMVRDPDIGTDQECFVCKGSGVFEDTTPPQQEAKDEPNYKKAFEVWLDKTEWVQETVKPHELGMHRADVLKQKIEEALAQRTWVEIDDEDFSKALELCDFDKIAAFDFFESKLKEKNT